MKQHLLFASAVMSAFVFAQDITLPPQEEAPFRIVIENVPEEEPESPVVPQTVPSSVAPQPASTAAALASDPSLPVIENREEEVYEEVEPNCSHVLTPPAGYSKEVLMLQIFLDRHNFSCGVIDGVWGNASREAMRAWQRSMGRRQTQWVDVPLYAEIALMEEPIIRHVITAEDVALVTGEMPPTWAERSKLDLMGYETLGACIAERFHTSERTLRRLNPGIINWPDDLMEGAIVMVPNVRMAALQKPETLVIALDDCVLAGYDAEGTIRLRFPCSIARRKAHLPETGDVKIKNMAPAPNYTYDPANYGQDSSVGKMVVPAGPRNPVGSRWIGLTLPGYGIHGSPSPNTVGRPESRGCFRLTNWNAEKLFELVTTGTQVKIVKSLATYQPVVKAVEEPVEAPEPIDEPVEEAEPVEEPVEAPAPAEPVQEVKPEPVPAPEPVEAVKETPAPAAVEVPVAPAPAPAPEAPAEAHDELAELEAELKAAAEDITNDAQ